MMKELEELPKLGKPVFAVTNNADGGGDVKTDCLILWADGWRKSYSSTGEHGTPGELLGKGRRVIWWDYESSATFSNILSTLNCLAKAMKDSLSKIVQTIAIVKGFEQEGDLIGLDVLLPDAYCKIDNGLIKENLNLLYTLVYGTEGNRENISRGAERE